MNIQELRRKIDESNPRNRLGFDYFEESRLKELFAPDRLYPFQVEAKLVAVNLDFLWGISNPTRSRKMVPSQIVVMTRNLPDGGKKYSEEEIRRAVNSGTRLFDIPRLLEQYKNKIISSYVGPIIPDDLKKYLSVGWVGSREGQVEIVEKIRSLVGGRSGVPVRVVMGEGVFDYLEDCWGSASGPGLDFKSILDRGINNPESFDVRRGGTFSVHQMDVGYQRMIELTPRNYVPKCRPI